MTEKRPRHREIFLKLYREGKVTEAVRAFQKEYLKQIRSVDPSSFELKRIGARLEILARFGPKFGRIIDHEPPNSKQLAEAVRQAKEIATESLRLAKLTGDPNLIEEAERTAAMLPC